MEKSSTDDEQSPLVYNKVPPAHRCLLLVVVAAVLAVVIGFPVLLLLDKTIHAQPVATPCGDSCSLVLAESIPSDLTFPAGSPTHISIYDAWMDLILSAEETIDIAAFYWTLRDDDLEPWVNSSAKGQSLFDTLIKVAKKKNLEVRIVVDSQENRSNDTKILEEMGVAEVRTIDMRKLVGSGVLHTKMWLVDGKHFSVGSANLDWRSLTEVKELVAIIKECSCYAEDLAKIFEVYWEMAKPGAELPSEWPSSLSTTFNKDTPLKLLMNKTTTETYLSSSPPQFCPSGRTIDLDAILDVMDKAKRFIDISVMNYLPLSEFTEEYLFWDAIDAKLRARAMDDRVKVRLMTGYWEHTLPHASVFLQSLAALNNTPAASGKLVMDIEVRQFVVPKNDFPVKYTRVNHCKFMVTDNAAYIGTSNWSKDYFVDTGGIGLIINNTASLQSSEASEDPLQSQLSAIFNRDWDSLYAFPVVVQPLKPPPLG